jgi:hypothetical protein
MPVIDEVKDEIQAAGSVPALPPPDAEVVGDSGAPHSREDGGDHSMIWLALRGANS